MTIAGLLLFTPACQQQVPDTRATDEQALRDFEAQWSKANAARDVEQIVGFYADEASNCLPNEPVQTGKEAIRAGYKKLFAQPGYTNASQVLKVEVSRGGDLGVTHGTGSDSWLDAAGKPVSDKGKWVTVYRKQAGGKWKAILNIYNSDLPAPPK